jgi:putative hydrolase of the HAD superfamily
MKNIRVFPLSKLLAIKRFMKAILVDMDDTLIFNEQLYEIARAKFCGYMRNFGVLQPEAMKDLYDTDAELFKTMGYSCKRFPQTFETVLKHYVPEADDEMVKSVREFAEAVFTTVAPVKAGVPEALAMLAKEYPVYIVTAGPKDLQQFRYDNLSFKDVVSGVFIVDKKDKAVFEKVVQKLGIEPSEAVMIGDSLRSDVFPSVEAGLSAVWIETHSSPHEKASGFPAKNAYKYSSLLEVARSILKAGKLVAPFAPPAPVHKPPQRKLG